MEYIQEKYGSTLEESRSTRDRLQALGRQFGFEFNYNDDMRAYNTFLSHQLLYWAKGQSKQTELKLGHQILPRRLLPRRPEFPTLRSLSHRRYNFREETSAACPDGRDRVPELC